MTDALNQLPICTSTHLLFLLLLVFLFLLLLLVLQGFSTLIAAIDDHEKSYSGAKENPCIKVLSLASTFFIATSEGST